MDIVLPIINLALSISALILQYIILKSIISHNINKDKEGKTQNE